MTRTLIALLASAGFATAAFAQSDMAPGVTSMDQDVSGGTVSASSVTAPEKGWLVVHRTDADMKPGPVVGHAPLEAGVNENVSVELGEDVASGDMLMLMVHSEAGGNEEGVFEYTLGATEDGPIRVDGELVTQTITAQ
ncbi:hypothetical protein U0C82_02405 [Fulvimarina sp. 2208YS6-2-32]|uniref:DUF7282 domain-containing protein n=1 Tax=Fulvimarina uroteuthidis TaxID=3098149 RepID=A0ABU5HXY6_9HYPH|nr:hypothetical protein [Fulvimarina sp. 2208YS6-2-32]MDY8108001.1 hypothetical protein [Fulvimarina sp. 2208YS6-2-32]